MQGEHSLTGVVRGGRRRRELEEERGRVEEEREEGVSNLVREQLLSNNKSIRRVEGVRGGRRG